MGFADLPQCARLLSRAAPRRPVRAGRSASLWRPSLRYGCPAMLGLAAPLRNSLRSLRSLRSDKRNEHDDDSRCARGRKTCASRRHRGAPRPARTGLCGSASLMEPNIFDGIVNRFLPYLAETSSY